jgi:hypothetical protein
MSNNLPLLPTLILSNCFDKKMLNEAKQEIAGCGKSFPYVHPHEGVNFGKTLSVRTVWDPKKDKHITDKILSQLPREVTQNLLVEINFHLQSFYPYDIHCDCGWLKLAEDESPYYLIIIPLESVEAKTVVLNQTSHGLHFIDYKNDTNVLSESERISDNDFETYFSHCWPQEKSYISVNQVFNWAAGDALMLDMRYFHSSDNYRKNNVVEKNCITLMTKIKTENFLHNLQNSEKLQNLAVPSA